jgi:hypothetical protein
MNRSSLSKPRDHEKSILHGKDLKKKSPCHQVVLKCFYRKIAFGILYF